MPSKKRNQETRETQLKKASSGCMTINSMFAGMTAAKRVKPDVQDTDSGDSVVQVQDDSELSLPQHQENGPSDCLASTDTTESSTSALPSGETLQSDDILMYSDNSWDVDNLPDQWQSNATTESSHNADHGNDEVPIIPLIWNGNIPTATDDYSESTSSSVPSDLPSCWDSSQLLWFTREFKWLVVKNGKLGCADCREFSINPKYKLLLKSIAPAEQWCEGLISGEGKGKGGSSTRVKTKGQQQTALRKKLHLHKDSKSHSYIQKLFSDLKDKPLEDLVAVMQKAEHDTTARVMRTAYKLAKLNRPFSDFQTDIDVQVLNGCDMGRILHSRTSCANIIEHISSEFQQRSTAKMVKEEVKFGFMLDESTSLGNKSSVAIYLRVGFDPEQCDPVNMFLSLTELTDMSAKGIFDTVIGTLECCGLGRAVLEKSLVSLCCDGASVMLGRKAGVGELFREQFPNIILWHCSAHRLELSVGDTVKEINQINHFRIFIDKLHHLYSASPKNQRELSACAQSLEMELLKIGKVLSTRWVASSHRTVRAVWESYPALHAHCKKASEDPKRDSQERATFAGCASILSSVEFLKNLSLMYDALQELSTLSLELQKRNSSIIDSHRSILIQIEVFKDRVDEAGKFEKNASEAIESGDFKGVKLHSGGRNREITVIRRGQFYRSLVNSLEMRLLTVRATNNDRSGIGAERDKVIYDELISQIEVLYPEHWPAGMRITHGDDSVSKLCDRFNLNDTVIGTSFRKYKLGNGKSVPNELSVLMSCLKCIPISSAECERAFSEMNLVITAIRASLLIRQYQI